MQPAPPLTLAQHLENAARRSPRAPALLSATREWSFAELVEEARRRAVELESCRRPLALAGGNLALALAAYACGFAGRPLWPQPPHKAESIPPGEIAGRKPGASIEAEAHKPGSAPSSEMPPLPPETALVISTSGSEGAPKAALLSHGNLDAASAAANSRLPLHPGDLWLACLPLHHVGGQAILWRCARAGAAVLVHEGFAAEAVAQDLAARNVTHVSLVPAMLARLLDLGAAPPPSLRCALVGGAALSRPLYERARAAGWPVYPTYGMSETAAQVATFDPAGGEWQEGLVGLPLPGNDIAIAADGRIRIRGPQAMLGYLNGEGRAGLGLEDGWLTTGDLGRLDDAGRLFVLGRADDMLVSGGSNIHPLAVESCLAACPGVADVAVAGQPDPVWGDRVVALVVGAASDDSILAWGRERLPAAARPRRILRLERLPRNALGKLERAALRQLVGGGAA